MGGGQVTEQPRETGLLRVAQVVLAAEVDDLVLQQGLPDRAEDVAGKVGGQAHAGDLGTDVACDAPDVDTGFGGGHEAPS